MCCACQTETNQPGCTEDAECEGNICGVDTFCCNTGWDSLCVSRATTVCTSTPYPTPYPTISPITASPTAPTTSMTNPPTMCCACTSKRRGEKSCSVDALCTANICSVDPYCCNTRWDTTCGDLASDVCYGTAYPTPPLPSSPTISTTQQPSINPSARMFTLSIPCILHMFLPQLRTCSVNKLNFCDIEFKTEPTKFPSEIPTNYPTLEPTMNPTIPPSAATSDPTQTPTKSPTVPTLEPTYTPSVFPTSDPTLNPTVNPTDLPSSSPSDVPTNNPTTDPSQSPSDTPSTTPSLFPSISPTQVTDNPTANPTTDTPTSLPTSQPSIIPTNHPSMVPTHNPTGYPSTSLPTTQPSIIPTEQPSIQPTLNPTKYPLSNPTENPTSKPSKAPVSGILVIPGNEIPSGKLYIFVSNLRNKFYPRHTQTHYMYCILYTQYRFYHQYRNSRK